MAVKSFNPVTKTLRFKTVADFSEISKKKPEKSLLRPIKKTGGRNSYGRITSRRRGGGHKKMYRLIDFTRQKRDIPARVSAIEYDPNRNCYIALVVYLDGEKAYIPAALSIKVDDVIVSGEAVPVKPGNAMPLFAVPPGTDVHNVEINPGRGAQIARSAGTFCTVMAKEGDFVHLRLPSGEVRLVRKNCYAVIGQVGNSDHENIILGSAGRSRWLGRRPSVRGMAMNPVDHPNGGGEGRSKSGGGWQHPRSPWGLLAKGQKTRKKKKYSNRLILSRRNKK